MRELREVSKGTRAWACYDCGKCTATCPISRVGGEYSPRRHVLAANAGTIDDVVRNGALYRCLTCSLCDRRCPAEVSYTTLVLRLREIARRAGAPPECPHGESLHSMMRLMARGGTRQERMGWLGTELATEARKGSVFYWTGCTMYYDAFFHDFQVATLEGTRAAIRLLNRLGITPVVSPDERCCGHDLLWNGDRENFELLARHNVGIVAESGAETLVVSCAECYRTWKSDYAPFFPGRAPRVVHLTSFLAERMGELPLKRNGTLRVTYQDPCRLGRHSGEYEAPRRVLSAVPGLELAEMRRSGPAAICCAGGSWSSCDRFAKTIQVERLREAKASGAELLATACPKCQVHFRCAMQDPHLAEEIAIPMRDVAEIVAGALGS